MKTAVSLPDELVAAADAFAARTGRSRSRLVADAIREYLLRQDDGHVTARLDEIAATLDSRLGPSAARASGELLTREPW